MVIDLKQCAALIREHNEFVIISHEHPDGDTLGCQARGTVYYSY